MSLASIWRRRCDARKRRHWLITNYIVHWPDGKTDAHHNSIAACALLRVMKMAVNSKLEIKTWIEGPIWCVDCQRIAMQYGTYKEATKQRILNHEPG